MCLVLAKTCPADTQLVLTKPLVWPIDTHPTPDSKYPNSNIAPPQPNYTIFSLVWSHLHLPPELLQQLDSWLIFPSVLFLNLSANWYQKSLMKDSLVSLFKMMSGSPWPWDKFKTHQGLWSTLVMCKCLLAFYLHLTRLHSSQSKCNSFNVQGSFISFWHCPQDACPS